MEYYNSAGTDYITGMKILPLQTSELKTILKFDIKTPGREDEQEELFEEIAETDEKLGELLVRALGGKENIKEIENALLQALEMPEEEQKATISNMQEIISSQHVGQWAKDFIDELVLVKKKNKEKV